MLADALKRLSPAAAALADADRLNDLGPGQPQSSSRRAALAALTADQLLASGSPRNPDAADACLAGLWLLWDFLDESHSVSQSLHTVAGSYWHAIMHRREPDYENSKYWFRRVGDHAIFPQLAAHARELALAQQVGAGAQFLITQATWDPYAFVDLCRSSKRGAAADVLLCQRIQQFEWHLLFADCVLAAGGTSR